MNNAEDAAIVRQHLSQDSSPSQGCIYCGVSPIGGRYYNAKYCWPCFNARRPLVVKAHRIVNAFVQAGLMPAADECYCVDCGGLAHVYDHRDYSRPLDVQPVCRSCNQKRGPAEWAPARKAA